MLKAPPPPSYFLDLHFSVIKCHCQTNDDNIGPKLKKAEVCYVEGEQYVPKLSPMGIDLKFVRKINKILILDLFRTY